MPEKKKKFKYKPLSLKDILKEMKQSIDLMIDLAYSAIKFSSKEIADEASKIEKRIHELIFLLNLQIIQTQAGGVKEAKKLNIPILALVDTNCDPDPIDYVVACNDDSLKSVKLILSYFKNIIKNKKKELIKEKIKEVKK